MKTCCFSSSEKYL